VICFSKGGKFLLVEPGETKTLERRRKSMKKVNILTPDFDHSHKELFTNQRFNKKIHLGNNPKTHPDLYTSNEPQ
jgi:hypothetical protein